PTLTTTSPTPTSPTNTIPTTHIPYTHLTTSSLKLTPTTQPPPSTLPTYPSPNTTLFSRRHTYRAPRRFPGRIRPVPGTAVQDGCCGSHSPGDRALREDRRAPAPFQRRYRCGPSRSRKVQVQSASRAGHAASPPIPR